MDAVLTILANLPALAVIFVVALVVIAGLGYIIYLLVKQRNDAQAGYTNLAANHLHELPDIAETLRRIERQQGHIAAGQFGQLSDIRESLAYIKAKLNGR